MGIVAIQFSTKYYRDECGQGKGDRGWIPDRFELGTNIIKTL